MNKHVILMLVGCMVPFLLIFLLPLFGISRDISILILVLMMFLCHFLMPMHHGGHHSEPTNR